MSDRPTPETDAMEYDDPLCDPPKCVESSFARRLERERDEARDAAEKAKAYKRVMKEDNAKLRQELDELNKRLIEVCQYGVVCTVEREDLHKEVAAERALADRLAGVLFGCTARDQNDAYDAWKEARK